MRIRLITLCAVAVTVLGIQAESHASLVSYDTRAAFDTANPGLPVENFEAANVEDGTFTGMANPLDKDTNNGVFSPGDILDGLRITAQENGDPTNLSVAAAGYDNYVSKTITYDFGPGLLTLDFYNNNVSAIGLDVTRNPDGGDVTLTYLSGATILGSFSLSNVPGTGTFFGVVSTSDVITTVQITGSDYFGVDNIAFGSAGSAVPEPSSLALVGTAALAGLGLWSRRRTPR